MRYVSIKQILACLTLVRMTVVFMQTSPVTAGRRNVSILQTSPIAAPGKC